MQGEINDSKGLDVIVILSWFFAEMWSKVVV